jgi:hypothetical protein
MTKILPGMVNVFLDMVNESKGMSTVSLDMVNVSLGMVKPLKDSKVCVNILNVSLDMVNVSYGMVNVCHHMVTIPKGMVKVIHDMLKYIWYSKMSYIHIHRHVYHVLGDIYHLICPHVLLSCSWEPSTIPRNFDHVP